MKCESKGFSIEKVKVESKGSCLKQDKVNFTPRNVVNVFIVYELDTWSKNFNAYFTLKDCLELIQINIIFSVSNNWGKNAIILEVDSSLSLHFDNNKKKYPTQELDDTKITAEGNYFINFTKSKRKCCLNMHYNVSNRFLFVNATKISIQSKTLK